MKAFAPFLIALSSGFVIDRRDDGPPSPDGPPSGPPGHWQPKTTNPHFFQLLVDDSCRYSNYPTGNTGGAAGGANGGGAAGGANGGGAAGGANGGGANGGGAAGGGNGGGAAGGGTKRQAAGGAGGGAGAGAGAGNGPAGGTAGAGTGGNTCQNLGGYAIRLTEGKVIATPYNKWKDPPIPTLFVDDDTTMYTVSKKPLQFYIDSDTGALKYTEVGWLPPDAISVGFYHTGSNPLGKLNPSPSYLTWPSTYGYTERGRWLFCNFGFTGQYQVFINDRNFSPQGAVDTSRCYPSQLAAIDANPWQKPKPHPMPPHHHSDDWSSDDDDDDES